MNDPEINAISEVTKALAGLSDEQRENVLLYVNARYGGAPQQRTRVNTGEDQQARGEFKSIGEFFDAANPQTESERVLVVAYWLQVIEGAPDFESYPVNTHLKNLGHPVSNITRAIDSMIAQQPRLIIQTSKSGNSKQARKKYKVTREGEKRVKAMLARTQGEDNGE